MDNSIQTDKKCRVPEDKGLRQRMRFAAMELVANEKVVPPVNLLKVASLSQQLLTDCGADPEYADFAMVLCGNELWRDIVAATPFARRLLLLPQCLKNNRNCSASFDQLGLICAGCQNCQIDDILNVAEELGYSTLVAEGTTVAIKLVEEGSVDAVIGVGCMSVLEKSFASVSRAAVPVIGIPLLYDGCENTEVDKAWLLSEIRSLNDNPKLQPLSVSLLKDRVQDWFSEENLLLKIGQNEESTARLVVESMLQGGQRMRPVLAAMAFSAYAEKVDEDIWDGLITIIECFHKASLIHDDIEDRDDLRYGKETLHRTHGIALSINAGDYLIGKGYELLADLPLNAEQLRKALRIVAGSHVLLTVGQGSDLWASEKKLTPDLDDLLETFRLKTGSAVKVAVLLGALLGGASDLEQSVLSEFADIFGIAYQMHDDLDEFYTRSEQFIPRDFPFIISLLKQKIQQSGRIWNKEFTMNVALFSEQLKIFELEKEAGEILAAQVQKVYACLDKLVNIRMKLALYGLTGKVFGMEKKGE